MEQWKVAWQYILDGYGNAIIGRYGGCFEEDKGGLCVIEHIISRGLDA